MKLQFLFIIWMASCSPHPIRVLNSASGEPISNAMVYTFTSHLMRPSSALITTTDKEGVPNFSDICAPRRIASFIVAKEGFLPVGFHSSDQEIIELIPVQSDGNITYNEIENAKRYYEKSGNRESIIDIPNKGYDEKEIEYYSRGMASYINMNQRCKTPSQLEGRWIRYFRNFLERRLVEPPPLWPPDRT